MSAKADLDMKFREVYELKAAALASTLPTPVVSSPVRTARPPESSRDSTKDSDEVQVLRNRVQDLAAALTDKEAQYEVLAHTHSLAEVCAPPV